MHRHVDRPFLITVLLLAGIGFFIFISASLGLLARDNITYSSIALNQALGLAIGLLACVIATHIPHVFWRHYAFYLFLASIGATLLVFVPGIGLAHGGAHRWLDLGPFSFQPSELLKVGFVMYFATWLASVRSGVRTWKYGVIPFIILLAVCGTVLVLQPDIGTLLTIVVAGCAMFIVAGARWRDVGIIFLCGILTVSTLVIFKPYLKDRVLTFIHPAADPHGAGYQIQQSLIAIGSGRLFGRGFGQSVQKFNFLPEPVGDSIFAVFAEEWGFVGSVALLFLFLFFVLRGLKIASNATNHFSALLVVGLVTLIITQSFLNIGSMLGILPLTGEPLLFVSQGGSALIVALLEAGIILHISKQQKN